jgi:catechol 2,3-dioxygenase-like lactoylglutathione lyase family enzyme
VRTLTIDHVTLAGRDLDAMRQRFEDLGLATDYGGLHSNGATQMAQLGFDDGSYLELISTVDPHATSPLWDRQIRDHAGPAAWAVRVDDLTREQQRLAAAGIRSRGPVPMSRQRPDGTSLAWDLLFPGDDAAGATLPFAIRDRTPRDLRVAPSRSVAAGDLAGVAQVVIAVGDIEATAALFRRAYGWGEPTTLDSAGLAARVAAFEHTPVALAQPTGQMTWLAERLARYGECPAAFLLAARGREGTASRLPLLSPEPWLSSELHWIDPARLFGWRIGLLLETS